MGDAKLYGKRNICVSLHQVFTVFTGGGRERRDCLQLGYILLATSLISQYKCVSLTSACAVLFTAAELISVITSPALPVTWPGPAFIGPW